MMRRRLAGLLALASFVVCFPASSADLVGRSSVIDGDTLEIHGQRVRLEGIDAPESRQMCDRHGQAWRCGQRAALALADWIGSRPVACRSRGKDRYGRLLARCSVAGADMQAWLVLNGHALAYRRYSTDYVPQEERAQAAGAGLWSGRFIAPWDWRRGER